jgi:uncharacterized metal-binding protein
MSDNQVNVCKVGPKLIFACSGAADVGNIADLAARQLTKEGKGKMFCLVGVGGQVKSIPTATQRATFLLAIDGCALDCAKKTLEKAGLSDVAHIRITDLGMLKGKTLINQERIKIVKNKARSILSPE